MDRAGPGPRGSRRLDREVLHLAGSAPRGWIEESRRLGRFVPGVTRVQDDGLVDADLGRLAGRIEGRALTFVSGRADLAPGQDRVLAETVADLRQLAAAARAAGRPVTLTIRGHTDGSGPEALNARLAQEPAVPETTERDRALNRRVTFQVRTGSGREAATR